MKNGDIFREDSIRTKNGYTPRYKDGFIGVRFLDDERKGDKYKTVTNNGELIIDYHEMFNNKNSDIVKYFEDKYKVKMSDFRKFSDDYYHYFECEVGKEREIMKQIYHDKMVMLVDFVDERWLEAEDIIEEIKDEIDDLELASFSDEKIKEKVMLISEKIKKIL